MQYAIPYLLIINAVSLMLMHWDKRNAKRMGPRVPEVVLMASALLGGSAGATVGMLVFHHKTRKPLFSIGLPLILLIQIAAFLLLSL